MFVHTGSDIGARTARHIRQKEHALVKKQLEQENKRLKECTFTPKTTTNKVKPEESDFFRRLESYQKKKDERLKKAQTEKKEQEVEDCTFTPEMSEASRKMFGNVKARITEDKWGLGSIGSGMGSSGSGPGFGRLSGSASSCGTGSGRASSVTTPLVAVGTPSLKASVASLSGASTAATGMGPGIGASSASAASAASGMGSSSASSFGGYYIGGNGRETGDRGERGSIPEGLTAEGLAFMRARGGNSGRNDDWGER